MSLEENGSAVEASDEAPASKASGEGSGGWEFDENGQRVPPGMGQSKSSRRRRRKRKSRGPETAGAATEAGSGNAGEPGAGDGGGVVMLEAAGDSGATSGATPGGENRSQGGRQGAPNASAGGANAAPGGTKRWKKKFRERGRGGEGQAAAQNGSGFAPAGANSSSSNGGGGGFRGPDTHQPGNGGSFKRKGGFGGGSNGGGSRQSRAPRGFVGPMDHSYRAVNGNFLDAPPSTMDPHGNGFGGGGSGGRRGGYQGDSQPVDYSQGRAIPIAEGAPTKIYFFLEDLFFTAKIQETARKLGVKVGFVKNDKESIAALTGGEEEERPGLIVFDLNNANAKPLTLIPKLKAKLKKSTSIVGFLSHLQGDLKAKAVEAGCDTVMPRAAFSQNLPNLLRRYGIEDVEEPNFNQ